MPTSSPVRKIAAAAAATAVAGFTMPVSAQEGDNGQAGLDPMAECRQAAKTLNAQTPMEVDKATTLTKVSCKSGENGGRIVYDNEVALNDSQLSNFDGSKAQKKLREEQLKYWCNNTQLRSLLDRLDVRYNYFASSGERLAQVDYTASDCG